MKHSVFISSGFIHFIDNTYFYNTTTLPCPLITNHTTHLISSKGNQNHNCLHYLWFHLGKYFNLLQSFTFYPHLHIFIKPTFHYMLSNFWGNCQIFIFYSNWQIKSAATIFISILSFSKMVSLCFFLLTFFPQATKLYITLVSDLKQ